MKKNEKNKKKHVLYQYKTSQEKKTQKKMWYDGIYKSLIIAAIVCFAISMFSQSKTSFNALLTGYICMTLGVMLILTILVRDLNSMGPFLLMLAVIAFMLYMLIYYRSPILENRVSSSYYTFSNITMMLIFLQLYIGYLENGGGSGIGSSSSSSDGVIKLSKMMTYLMYLIGVLSSISSIVVFVILKFYRTDGFQLQR